MAMCSGPIAASVAGPPSPMPSAGVTRPPDGTVPAVRNEDIAGAIDHDRSWVGELGGRREPAVPGVAVSIASGDRRDHSRRCIDLADPVMIAVGVIGDVEIASPVETEAGS